MFSCSLCHFEGKNERSLVIHLRLSHKDINIKEYDATNHKGLLLKGYVSEKTCKKIIVSTRKAERTEKIKLTKQFLYGNPHYNNMTKNKATKLKRYGDSNYNNPEKRESTLLERHGVSTPFLLPRVIEKSRESMLKKYGVLHGFQSGAIQQKCKRSSRCKWYTYQSMHSGVVRLQGSYELVFAKILDNFCDLKYFKEWKRNTRGYPYISFIDRKVHYYIPDFIATDSQDRIFCFEPKGELLEIDLHKIFELQKNYNLHTWLLLENDLDNLCRIYFRNSFRVVRKQILKEAGK